MSATKKLRWKRNLNYLRFCHEELDMVSKISNDVAPEFQQFYEQYCRDKNIDLVTLSQQNSDRIEKAYNRKPKPNPELSVPELGPDTGEIVVRPESDLGEEPPQEAYEMSQDDHEIHEAFSKLFKKIALVIHPDKMDDSLSAEEKNERADLFRDANRAFSDKKYFILLDIAEKFKISTPKNYDQQIRWMKRKTKGMEEQIRKQKTTYNFKFAESETIEAKEILVTQFLKQLFNI